jgi:hypothetical protein
MRFVWWLASVACGAAVSTMAACSNDDTTPQQGSGNDFVGTDATTQPGQSSDGGPDSPFAPVEGGLYPGKPDGYDPVGICAKCACPAGDYCFGGGNGYTTFGGSCTPTAFGIGCQPIPAACASAGDAGVCDCLLQATSAKISCYGVCVDSTLTVYCPNP